MSSKEHAERLSRALDSTGACEAVSASFGDKRVAVLCRVPGDRERKWLELIQKVLVAAQKYSTEAYAWQCHICRNYFLKEVGGEDKVVWGWNFSIQSREMTAALEFVIRILKGQPIPISSGAELTEFPIAGAPADRNAPRGGKGVQGRGEAEFHPARSK